MVAKKLRIVVVVDTSVFIRNFKSRRRSNSPNCRVIRLWLFEKELQLVVSPELINEYLEGLEEVVELDEESLADWRWLLENDARVTVVRPVKKLTLRRDAKDNFLLNAALAANAEYLITNDKDLLEISEENRRRLPFSIVTPIEFLHAIEAA